MTNIYLIRHCEGEGNACRRSQTLYDGLVTTKGMAQAEALRKRFHDMNIDAVYSSDSYRARMTADPIAKDHGLVPRYRMLLREYSVGVWDGTPNGNVPLLYPEYYEHNSHNPGDARYPGGDTYASIERRAQEILRRLISENRGKTIAVVSHALMLRIMLCYIAGLERSQVNQIEYGDNTAVSLISAGEDDIPHIEFLADATHLTPELRRPWTVSGSNVNMTVELYSPARDAERLIKFDSLLRAKHGLAPQSAEDCLLNANGLIAQNPAYVAFFLLNGETQGLLYMADAHGLGCEYAAIDRYFMADELREREFDLQMLGHAIHTARVEARRYLACPTAADTHDAAMLARFPFYPIPDQPHFMQLDIVTPGCRWPVV